MTALPKCTVEHSALKTQIELDILEGIATDGYDDEFDDGTDGEEEDNDSTDTDIDTDTDL